MGKEVDFHEAENERREIWIRLDGPRGRYSVELEGSRIRNGRFDATLNPSRFRVGTRRINRFKNFIGRGSIWDLATARNNICPNSYVIRRQYRDIDCVLRTLDEGALGDLWNGSGVGPTFDGRLGVDISAPGDSIFTTYGENSHWRTFRWNLLQGHAGRIGRAGAVSAANPIVTGIIALMLEMDSSLDAIEVREILRSTAATDRFTGDVPNSRWGYGKVDALAAVDFVYRRLMNLRITRTGVGNVHLVASGKAGLFYEIQTSPNLIEWEPLARFEAATVPSDFDVRPDAEQRYFRLVFAGRG